MDQGEKRWQHTAVWRPNGHRMLAFGGLDENGDKKGTFWEYRRQTDTWTSGPTGPAARVGHVAVWDDNSDRMLMCCGVSDVATLSDLWSFQGSSWTELVPWGSITARGFPSVVWDPTARAMLGFGGQDGSSSYLQTLFQQPICI